MTIFYQDVIMRGLASARPASAITGALYFATDTQLLERWNGTAWEEYGISSGHNHVDTKAISMTIGNGFEPIALGAYESFSIPTNGTWVRYRILGRLPEAQNGSIQFDIWKEDYAAYPPGIGATILSGAHPSVTNDIKAESTTLTGWNTDIDAGDHFFIVVDSVTNFTLVKFELWYTVEI